MAATFIAPQAELVDFGAWAQGRLKFFDLASGPASASLKPPIAGPLQENADELMEEYSAAIASLNERLATGLWLAMLATALISALPLARIF